MLKNMSKKNLVILVVVILVVVVLGFYWTNRSNDYSVVYLVTGEVYVGKVTTFPDFQLRGSYILQVAKDATDPAKSNFQLNPIDEALWAPKVLHINKENVVFYGPILPTSKIGEALAAKGE